MKHCIALVLVVFFAVLLILPLYAAEISTRGAAGDVGYAEKIRENNKKIATFVADTVKLPEVLVGDFTDQDHAKVVNETKYEGHEKLHDLQKYIIKR